VRALYLKSIDTLFYRPRTHISIMKAVVPPSGKLLHGLDDIYTVHLLDVYDIDARNARESFSYE
jgi:hypothetical protein